MAYSAALEGIGVFYVLDVLLFVTECDEAWFVVIAGAFIASFDAKSTRGFNSSSPSMSQGFGNDWLFWGTSDPEFFTYLLQSAINLDKIIFYPYHPREFKGEKSEGKNEVRKHARQLAKRLPPGVKSVVL